MNRTVALLAALGLAVTGAAVPVAGSSSALPVAADQAGSAQTGPPNASVAPGAQLSGIVAVQGAEVEGEVEERSFGIQVARAASNRSKAGLVVDQVTTADERLAALRNRTQELEVARENGNISEARFRAEMAVVATRTRIVERQLNRTATVSEGLPADVLAERGVNATAIERLRSGVRDLSGPEVAGIARSIAGPNPGGGLSAVGNGTAGPPETPPGRSDAPGNASPRSTPGQGPPSTTGDAGPESDGPQGGGAGVSTTPPGDRGPGGNVTGPNGGPPATNPGRGQG